MDWIERFLHFDPDGGNGYVEWVILAFVVFLVVRVALRLARARVRAQGRKRSLR
ncbi:MAG: hypothetical protein ACJ74X_11455 [Gaiellaceae bacterium]